VRCGGELKAKRFSSCQYDLERDTSRTVARDVSPDEVEDVIRTNAD
jgi:hypothetical protein